MTKYFVAAATFLATAVTISVPAMAIQQGHPGGIAVTRAQMQGKVQARFAALDANHDGNVTKAEFAAGRARMSADRPAMHEGHGAGRLGGADAGNDGRFPREAFADRGGRGPDMRDYEGLGSSFRKGEGYFAAIDTNRDGRVTLAEASALPLAMFDRADTNKDGTVTPDERRAGRIAARAAWAATRG